MTDVALTGAATLSLNGTQEKILDLLGAGVPQVQVATAVGVDESYVSQLMAEDWFRGAVQERRAAHAVESIEHDEKIDSIERRAWERIDKLLPLETNLMKLLKVAQVANAAKRKSEVAVASTQPATIVNIALPQSALVQFKMTSDKQVIEIEGRSMNTMPSHVVQSKLREKKAASLLVDQTQLIPQDMASKLAAF